MVVDLLLNDYVDAEDLNEYLHTWDMEMLDRKYTATETLLTVYMTEAASNGWTADDLKMDLEDEYLVGVKIIDVQY